MGTGLDAQTEGSAVTTLTRQSTGQGTSPSTGGNAAAIDQLVLAIQEEVLRSALFGPPDGVRGPKKNPSDT